MDSSLASTMNGATTGPLSVLLIESDAGVRLLVSSALKVQGYRLVGTMTSVRGARRIVDREKPDIVLLNGKRMPSDEARRLLE